jgi:hypothetical protein
MASWGCPHEVDGACQRVNQAACDPGMRGCVLYGRFEFSNPAKTGRPRPVGERRKRRAGRIVTGIWTRINFDRTPDYTESVVIQTRRKH